MDEIDVIFDYDVDQGSVQPVLWAVGELQNPGERRAAFRKQHSQDWLRSGSTGASQSGLLSFRTGAR